jgi:prolyl-tRNA editing enzyme YbaK/EbsC (Cys-tRNA(Pro) deacylase)
MTSIEALPHVQPGDRVVVDPHRVGEAQRIGVITEVLGGEHPRYRMLWEDGHETVFAPGSDAHIERHPEHTALLKDMPGLRVLEERHIAHELLVHAPTLRAGDEAAALGLQRAEVGKTVIVLTPAGPVRAVVSAADKLSLPKLRGLVGGGKETRLAGEKELAGAYPMFELGAVPPFGGPAGDRVVIDETLAKHDRVVVEAGSHDQSVRLLTKDLIAITTTTVADIRQD